MSRWHSFIVAFVLGVPAVSWAAPYTPERDGIVLERLPSRSDPGQRELAELRAQLRLRPRDPALAARVAQQDIALARASADPRYLGYAQAALAPWWDSPTPPPAVLIMRATILQSTHQFSRALIDLDTLIHQDPDNAQAWLTRATVLQVRGDFSGARLSCTHLFGRAPDLVLRTCLANVNNLTGHARTSYQSLLGTYQARRHTDAGIDSWVLTLLGEMAARLGDARAAEQHFRAALALAPDDSYLLGAYADLLLDSGRPREVVALLENRWRADGLLLRAALALDVLHDPRAPAARTMLRDRFDAAAMRGDTVHQREQARFELHLNRNRARALALARANWQIQKEPADLRILYEAARASGNRAVLDEIQAWLRQTGFEDATLRPARAAGEQRA